MKKGWIILTGAMLFYLGLQAQETTVTATHTNGYVEYYTTPNAVPKRVYPGMKMDLSGGIRCHADASVKLLYNGVTVVNNSQKTTALSEIVGSVDGEGQAGFTGRFWNFIHKSVEEGDNPEKLKEHHQSFMERTRGSKKGMGAHAYPITVLPSSSGLLPLGAVDFRWRKTASGEPYIFEIKASDGKSVALLRTRDTLLSLQIGQLDLDPHGEYEWSVGQGSSDHSAALPFHVSGDITNTAVAKLQSEKAYTAADPVEQQLMLAFYFEEMKCYYLADAAYRQLRNSAADNRLVAMTYAAFLSRVDQLQEAQQLVRN